MYTVCKVFHYPPERSGREEGAINDPWFLDNEHILFIYNKKGNTYAKSRENI